MVPLACAVVVVAAVGTGVANARTDTAAGPAAKAADTLTVMGFGTNGDEVAKSRFELAQKAVGGSVDAPNGGFNDQQFLAAVASGNPPDVVYLDRQKVGTYAAKGAFVPLSSCIKSQNIDLTQYRKPALAEVTYKGNTYGIPEFYSSRTVIVNLDALKKAGLTPKQLDTRNWPTLEASTKKLVSMKGSKLARIGFDPKIPEFFPMWAKANGVTLLSSNGLKANLNDPKAVEALTYAVNLIKMQGGWGRFKSFRDSFDFFGAGNEYAKDQLGAFPMEDWYYNVLATNSPKVKIQAMPFHDKKGNIVNFETGSAWAIPKGAKHADLACTWMKTMTSVNTWMAAGAARIQTTKEKGTPFTGLSTANLVADEKIFKTYYKPLNKYFDQSVKTVQEAQKHAFGMPASPASAEFAQAWQDAINKVLGGQATPKAALDQAQKGGQKAIDDAAK